MSTEDFIEQNMGFYNRYKKSLNELKLLKMQKELKDKNIEVHYGVSGSGKTWNCY